MTVATQTNVVSYTGNAVTTNFAFSFPIYDASHLLVYSKLIATGVLTLVTSGNYTISGLDNPAGGSITMTVAPAATVKILITRQLGLTQDLDVDNQGGFYPESVEQQFDLLAMQIQQLNEKLDRTIRTQVGDTLSELPAAAARAGMVAKFTSTGTDVELINPSSFIGAAGPTGPTGATGATGATGGLGATGAAGANGAAATITVGTVTTGAPGSSVAFANVGTTSAAIFNVTIPRGDPGASGALGDGTYAGIVVTGTGSALNVVAGHITLARMANLAANSILGNNTGAGAVPIALTAAQVKTMLAIGQADVTNLTADLALKAALVSPAFTGTPTAPTAAWGVATTQIASTEFVDRLRNLPLIRAVAAPIAELADRGGVVEATTSAALPANATVAFPVGSLVIFYNDSGVNINLTITTDTLRLAGTTSTGTRVIGPRGYASCRKRATTEWTVSGDVA